MTRDQAKIEIKRLVDDFRERNEEFHSPDYKEHNLKQTFLVPFFYALGWDVENRNGVSEAFREVIPEDSLKVKGSTKAPDYGFRLQGSDKKRLFFVEAKKPAVSLKTNKEASYQLRRYGRSAQTPVSILTNFEDFIVYDCTKRPTQNDSASVARIKHIHFEDYLKEFDFIYDTFSHEAVLKGRFEKFVKSDTYKKGTQALDKDFVESLDAWRKYLAVSIALNNQKLNEDEINYVVQQTIDRLIFLRFCEDRGIEAYGQMQATASKGDTYKNLYELFKQADAKYNSGLFDFKKDTLSANLKIDNKVLKTIITELYYPDCEYDFRVMPVEVLGNAYEQFLGKVIRITAAHSARIEEKPEVRKAGGVYYTPQYIVEYIVKNTVGKLIEGKTPKEIEKIKIVDPACGSGSFLIGAYQFLLDYHIKWYHDNGYANKKTKDNPLTPTGTLATFEKKKILLNNIFGVDLDANAVEVSKLSLLLKCMEGETEASVKQQLSVFHERVLPSLEGNIKDGNSLIDTDFYDNQFDLGFEKKIKPFSWKKNFPEVFKQEGFDVVIGNPPWGAEITDDIRGYIVEKFPLVPTKTKDTYFYFLLRTTELLRKNGFLGLILPNTWLLINNAKDIRTFLLQKELIEIIDYGDSVFSEAIVEASSIILINDNSSKDLCEVKRFKKGKLILHSSISKILWKEDKLNRFNIDVDDQFDTLFKKLSSKSESFETKCEIIFGIKPYQIGHGKPKQTKETVTNRIFHSEKLNGPLWKPLLTGTDVNRYVLNFPGNQYIKYGEWLMYKSNERKILGEKILLRRTSDTIRATFDDQQYYPQNSIFIITSATIDLHYLLGIINSKLFAYIYRKKCPQEGKIFAEVKPSIIKELPIRKINNLNKTQVELKNSITKNVGVLLKLNSDLSTTKLYTGIATLKQRIDHIEDKINQLVYELYELTPEEIKIVEGVAND